MKLALVVRRVAGGGRLPETPAAHATVLRLGHAHQGFLGNGVDGVVVRLAAEDEAHVDLLLVKQRVGLVHGHVPVARERLLGAVAQVGLVAGVLRQTHGRRDGLVRLHALLGGDVGSVLHHDDVVGIGVVVLHPQHAARHLVEGIVGFRSPVGPVGRVGVDVDVVAVVDIEIARRLAD